MTSMNRAAVTVATAFLMAGACGDSSPPPDETRIADAGSASMSDAGPGPTGDGSTADAGDPSAPLFAISSTIFGVGGGTSSSFVFVVSSLGEAADAEVDVKKVPEYAGGARAYGPEKKDVVYLTSSEGGTLTEVTFEPDGSQSKGRVLSLANLGIGATSGGNVNVFLSETKAYHVNQNNLSVVVWNPKEMSITKTVPLGLKVAEGYAFRAFSHIPLLVDGKLVLVSNSFKSGGGGVASDQVAVVVDTSADSVISSQEESRCSGAFQWARAANGDVYFATNSFLAAMHIKTPTLAPAPCALRMKAGQTTFDPTWMRTLDGDVGSRIWGSFVDGPAGDVLTRVLPESAPEVIAAKDALAVNALDLWGWWATAPDRGPAREFKGLPPSSGSTQTYQVDGKSILVGYDTKTAKTTLIDATAVGGPKAGVTVPGYVYNVIRIR